MKLGIVGGGAWGTALAQVTSANSQDVLLWALEPDVVMAINGRRENPLFLAGVELNGSIRATGDLSALFECEALLVVTPTQHTRSLLEQLSRWDKPLILCAKGIEERSGKLLHEVAKNVARPQLLRCSPGRRLRTKLPKVCQQRSPLPLRTFSSPNGCANESLEPTFRTYVSDDVTGAEIGGAVKNVLAIACGVVEGKGLGQNARAALIARGFAEMRRFGLACGAKRETLSGLSGLGDLVLTCSSTSSRNYSLGVGIGEGRPATELLSNRRTVAEGAFTAPVLARLALEKRIEMPIVSAVDALVAGRANVDQVLDQLLSRPPKAETA